MAVRVGGYTIRTIHNSIPALVVRHPPGTLEVQVVDRPEQVSIALGTASNVPFVSTGQNAAHTTHATPTTLPGTSQPTGSHSEPRQYSSPFSHTRHCAHGCAERAVDELVSPRAPLDAVRAVPVSQPCSWDPPLSTRQALVAQGAGAIGTDRPQRAFFAHHHGGIGPRDGVATSFAEAIPRLVAARCVRDGPSCTALAVCKRRGTLQGRICGKRTGEAHIGPRSFFTRAGATLLPSSAIHAVLQLSCLVFNPIPNRATDQTVHASHVDPRGVSDPVLKNLAVLTDKAWRTLLTGVAARGNDDVLVVQAQRALLRVMRERNAVQRVH
eukprot:3000935-Rhodomonas_salina.3